MRKLFAYILFSLLQFAALAQSSIQVEVPNVVALDEQFNLTFVIDGENSPSDFQWSAGNDFQLVWGPQKGTSTSIQIINGKRIRSSQFTYTYILIPKAKGTFQIPQASAKVKGNTIVSQAKSVEVVSNGSSSSPQASSGQGSQGQQTDGSQSLSKTISDGDIFLRFSLSKTNVVIGEPVTASLKLYQRVNIAGFEKAKFPTFNGFWSKEVASPTNIEFHRESLDDKIYEAALLRSWVLIPQQAGELTIEPAELVCLVNVRVAPRSSNSIFDSFFQDDYQTIRKGVKSPAFKVRVSALPAGAPASFGGGVGKYTISAKLSKDSLRTHDAASLILTVSGTGNVTLLEAPKVKFPPDFEVYDVKTTDSGTSGTSGSKTFEYPFIPRSHGKFTIDPVEYSYYDAAAGKYVTLSTQAIDISVAKGKDSTGGASSAPAQLPGVRSSGVKDLGNDIRFISTRIPALTAKGSFFLGSGLFWALVSLLILAAGAFLFAFRGLAARRADVAGTKNRTATKMARKRLKLSGDFLSRNLYTAFYEELHKALLGFVSDKLNMDMTQLNRDNISAALAESGVEDSLIGEFTGLLDACEFARYSPDGGHEAMQQHFDSAVSVISSMDSSMRGKKMNAGKASGAAIAALLLMISPALDAKDNSLPVEYTDSLWNRGIEAYNAGQWKSAVNQWTSIVKAGVESPEVYYNIGNASFKDEDYSRAILNYERALKLDPSFKDARYNLDFTQNYIQDKIEPVPEFMLKSLLRKASWTLDSDSWAVLSVILLALFLSMAILFLLGPSSGARKAGFYSAIAFALLGLSCLGFSAWQKSAYMNAGSAIVMSPVISVQSSPTETSAKDLFVLHEGTKVRLLDEVGSWKNIALADGREGWVKTEDLEVI